MTKRFITTPFPKVGDKFVHYKNPSVKYLVLGLGLDDKLESVVIYQRVNERPRAATQEMTGPIWCRTLSSWTKPVDSRSLLRKVADLLVMKKPVLSKRFTKVGV
jgi:hypothetical protein